MSVQSTKRLLKPAELSYQHNDFAPFITVRQVFRGQKTSRYYIVDGLKLKYRKKFDGFSIRSTSVSDSKIVRIQGHCNVTYGQLNLLLPIREQIKRVYFDNASAEMVDFILGNCPNITIVEAAHQFNLTLHQQVCLIGLKLERLNLYCMTLNEEMAAKWAGVISNNPTFQYLDLSTVKMSPRAAEKLLIGLNKSSAVKLNLDCDTLPTQSLGQTLTQLKTLQQIKIDCFEYTKEAADYLVQQMATLPNLVNVTIKRPPSLEAVLGFIQQSKSVQMIRFYCCDYTEPELNQLLDLVEFIDRKVRLEITASLGVPCASDIFRERIEQVNA